MADNRVSEMQTASAMIHMFCNAHHHTEHDTLCSACNGLAEYVNNRIERCVYGAAKPTCNNCSIHCYPSSQRDQIRVVMRYSGPRMIYKHPLMAIRHFLKGKKKK